MKTSTVFFWSQFSDGTLENALTSILLFLQHNLSNTAVKLPPFCTLIIRQRNFNNKNRKNLYLIIAWNTYRCENFDNFMICGFVCFLCVWGGGVSIGRDSLFFFFAFFFWSVLLVITFRPTVGWTLRSIYLFYLFKEQRCPCDHPSVGLPVSFHDVSGGGGG